MVVPPDEIRWWLVALPESTRAEPADQADELWPGGKPARDREGFRGDCTAVRGRVLGSFGAGANDGATVGKSAAEERSGAVNTCSLAAPRESLLLLPPARILLLWWARESLALAAPRPPSRSASTSSASSSSRSSLSSLSSLAGLPSMVSAARIKEARDSRDVTVGKPRELLPGEAARGLAAAETSSSRLLWERTFGSVRPADVRRSREAETGSPITA